MIQFTLQSSVSARYKMAVRAISGRSDRDLGNGGESEEADKWLIQQILRRDICQPW